MSMSSEYISYRPNTAHAVLNCTSTYQAMMTVLSVSYGK